MCSVCFVFSLRVRVCVHVLVDVGCCVVSCVVACFVVFFSSVTCLCLLL